MTYSQREKGTLPSLFLFGVRNRKGQNNDFLEKKQFFIPGKVADA